MQIQCNAVLVTVVVSSALIGCTTKPAVTSSIGAQPTVYSAASTNSQIVPGSARDFEADVGNTVHFEYDRFDIRENDRTTLERQATWLARYPSV